MSSLQDISYDILLSITQYLDAVDICALQLTCKHLYYAVRTYPVYRGLARNLLQRCRALPLYGFRRLSDLSMDQLMGAVNRAAQLERGWLTRTPRPAVNAFSPDGKGVFDGIAKSCNATGQGTMSKHWYKVVGMPQDAEIDWLTPITPSYMLYAMSSGKMVCWDVHQDVGIAEWSPDEQWMSWESRFELEQRVVYLMMARVLRGRDDEKVMQFELMQIHFPEQKPDSDEQISPSFTTLRSFKALGIVMNVFLLDPEARLLAGLVWIKRFNTVGLYVLLDWNKEEYVFVDTGIKCTYSANRTCILCEGSVVIHIREATFVCQHFFPLSVLAQHAYPSDASPSFAPQLSMRLKPTRSISQGFKFPILPSESCVSTPRPRQHIIHDIPIAGPENPSHPATLPQLEDLTRPIDVIGPLNPWSDDLWYPDNAHFLRQWWPTLPSVPHLRCTVVLLAQYDPRTLATKYVITQHYFTIPLHMPDAEADRTDALMRMWCVSAPFEIVCVPEQVLDESATGAPREQPLFAVDFGHAAWLEHVRTAHDEEGGGEEPDKHGQKRLRFVSFPGVQLESDGHVVRSGIGCGGGPDGTFEMEGAVRTLEIPDELDLDDVEAISIDQSQGTLILSVRQRKVFILCYE